MDNRHPCLASGYKILVPKATNHNLGGIALLWKENHWGYEVEPACIVTPNLLTFQLVTGNKKFYCTGIYFPPTDTMGVEHLWAAWEACSAGCTPIVLGGLKINFRDPRNEQEELILDLFNDIIVDTSRLHSLMTTQTISQVTVDLVAQKIWEKALLATRLY